MNLGFFLAQFLLIGKEKEKFNLTTKQGGNKMKRSIVLVGVMLLVSSMTLTTTAFELRTDMFCRGTGVIKIENKNMWQKIKSNQYADLYKLRIRDKIAMTSLNRKDRDRAALAYEKAGACDFYNSIKQPVCFVSKIKGKRKYTYTLSMATHGPHNTEVIMTSGDRESVVEAALEYEKNDECIYSVL